MWFYQNDSGSESRALGSTSSPSAPVLVMSDADVACAVTRRRASRAGSTCSAFSMRCLVLTWAVAATREQEMSLTGARPQVASDSFAAQCPQTFSPSRPAHLRFESGTDIAFAAARHALLSSSRFRCHSALHQRCLWLKCALSTSPCALLAPLRP